MRKKPFAPLFSAGYPLGACARNSKKKAFSRMRGQRERGGIPAERRSAKFADNFRRIC